MTALPVSARHAALAAALLLVAPAPPASAENVLSGSLVRSAKPASAEQGGHESSTNVRIWCDTCVGQRVGRPIAVDIDHVRPATYGSDAALPGGVVPAGRRVRSYTLHFDPVGTTTTVARTGTAVFDGDVLGVVVSAGKLKASDWLGGDTGYPVGSTRGLDFSGANPDSVGVNGRTVSVHMAAQAYVDEVRVLVDAPTVPQHVASVAAAAGDAQATVSWVPDWDGGAAVQSWSVAATADPDASRPAAPAVPVVTVPGSAGSAVVPGLVNGRSYTFRVVGRNAAGTKPFGQDAEGQEPPTANAVPRGLPGAPAGVTAAAGDGRAVVSWLPPAGEDAQPVTGYEVRVGSVAVRTGPDATEATVTGLRNGVPHPVQVQAVTAEGLGAAGRTADVVPFGRPSAPAGVTVRSVVGGVEVSWTPPAGDGGRPVLTYRVDTQPEGPVVDAPGTAAHAVVRGLDPEQVYRFTVRATNVEEQGAAPADGPAWSDPTAASDAVAPLAPEPVTVRLGRPSPVDAGTAVRVQARLVRDTDASAVVGQRLLLLSRPVGGASWRTVGPATTATGSGLAGWTVRPASSTEYRVVFEAADVFAGATSQAVRLVVRPRLSLVVASRTATAAVLRGRLAPAHAGQTVVLQRALGTGWREAGRARTAGGAAVFRVPLSTGTRYRLAVAADADHGAAVSPALLVRR
ncbi:MAG: fibronectin type protein [Frankiales bacterium]|nr:fibronectin type protein [Frankiales bacterium]